MSDSGLDQVDSSMVEGADNHKSSNSLVTKTPIVRVGRRMVVPPIRIIISLLLKNVNCCLLLVVIRSTDLSKQNGKSMDIYTHNFMNISTSLLRVVLID